MPVFRSIFADTAVASGGDGTLRAKPQLTFITTTSTTTASPLAMRNHLASQSMEELVRPSKLPPRPLHDLDVLHELQMKDDVGGKSAWCADVLRTVG